MKNIDFELLMQLLAVLSGTIKLVKQIADLKKKKRDKD
jgi:hypothetical protein